MSLKSSIKYEFRCLLILLALYGVVFQSVQAKDCTKKYYATNTIVNVSNFLVTCYSTDSGCGIYLDQNGQGCTNGGLVYAGTVSVNQTDKITLPLNVGTGICSSEQISVRVKKNVTGELVELPRASDAGTRFMVNLQSRQMDIFGYEITMQALAEDATVTYRFNPDDAMTSLKLGSYQFRNDIQHAVQEFTYFYMEIESSTPIVVSISGITNGVYGTSNVLRPVANEPVVVYNEMYNSLFTLAVVDCDTNQFQPNASRVEVQFVGIQGHHCYYKHLSDSPFAYVMGNGCLIAAIPLDNNTCISTVTQSQEGYLAGVGVPQSKSSTRQGNLGNQWYSYIVSFSNRKCFYGLGTRVIEDIDMYWIRRATIKRMTDADTFPAGPHRYWTECPGGAFFVLIDNYEKETIHLGYESESNWQQFFNAEGC